MDVVGVVGPPSLACLVDPAVRPTFLGSLRFPPLRAILRTSAFAVAHSDAGLADLPVKWQERINRIDPLSAGRLLTRLAT